MPSSSSIPWMQPSSPYRPCKRQERDVDAGLPEHEVDVAVDEQGPRVVAAVGEGRDDGLARSNRHVPLRRESAHENADLCAVRHASKGNRARAAVKKTAEETGEEQAAPPTRQEARDIRDAVCGKDGRHDFPRGGPRPPSARGAAAALQGPDRTCPRQEAADLRGADARGDDADAAHRGGEEGPGKPVRSRQTGRLRPASLPRAAGGGAGGEREGRPQRIHRRPASRPRRRPPARVGMEARVREATAGARRTDGARRGRRRRGRGRGVAAKARRERGRRGPAGAAAPRRSHGLRRDDTDLEAEEPRSPGCRPRRGPPRWPRPAFSRQTATRRPATRRTKVYGRRREPGCRRRGRRSSRATTRTRTRAKRRSGARGRGRRAARPARVPVQAPATRHCGVRAGSRRGGGAAAAAAVVAGARAGLSEKARVRPRRRRAKELRLAARGHELTPKRVGRGRRRGGEAGAPRVRRAVRAAVPAAARAKARGRVGS